MDSRGADKGIFSALNVPAAIVSLPLLALAILGITLLPDRYPAGGFLWDLLNGLGFAALAILVFLGWDSGHPASQPRLRLHSNLAVAGSLLVVAHAVGFLVADPLLLEYLKPTAPLGMLAGLLAALAMLAVTVTSYPTLRRRCYGTYQRFRWWHRTAGIVLLGLSLWHAVAAGYSVGSVPGTGWSGIARLVLLLPFVALLPLAAVYRRAEHRALPSGPAPASRSVADREAMMVLLMLILLAVVWAAIKNL